MEIDERKFPPLNVTDRIGWRDLVAYRVVSPRTTVRAGEPVDLPVLVEYVVYSRSPSKRVALEGVRRWFYTREDAVQQYLTDVRTMLHTCLPEPI